MRFRGDIVGRDYVLVTLRGWRVDFTKYDLVDGMESLVMKDGRKKIDFEDLWKRAISLISGLRKILISFYILFFWKYNQSCGEL